MLLKIEVAPCFHVLYPVLTTPLTAVASGPDAATYRHTCGKGFRGVQDPLAPLAIASVALGRDFSGNADASIASAAAAAARRLAASDSLICGGVGVPTAGVPAGDTWRLSQLGDSKVMMWAQAIEPRSGHYQPVAQA